MITKIFEATNKDQNWGKFMVCRPDTEWQYTSQVDPGALLLRTRGWTREHVWVMDLQTGEGAYFKPGGLARADLNKHRIWVCPLFEPFLRWLYRQDLTELSALPDVVQLPDAEFAMYGYRRPGLSEFGNEPEKQENRRQFIAQFENPKTREYVIEMFADLGLTQ